MCHFTATGHTKIIKIVRKPSSGMLPMLHGHTFGSLGQCLPLASLLHPSSPEPVPWWQIKGILHGLFLLIRSRHPRQNFSEGSAVHRHNTIPSKETSSSHKPKQLGPFWSCNYHLWIMPFKKRIYFPITCPNSSGFAPDLEKRCKKAGFLILLIKILTLD